jgi:chaperonin GroES
MSKPIFQPTADNIVLSVVITNPLSKTKLIIPDTYKDRSSEFGRVVAIGPDVNGIKEGQKVLFEKFAGQTVQIDNEEYILVPESDVKCIINE